VEELTQIYRKATRSLQAKDNEEKDKCISKQKNGQKKTIKPTWASAIFGEKKTVRGVP
jgi:hypothetical protein